MDQKVYVCASASAESQRQDALNQPNQLKSPDSTRPAIILEKRVRNYR